MTVVVALEPATTVSGDSGAAEIAKSGEKAMIFPIAGVISILGGAIGLGGMSLMTANNGAVAGVATSFNQFQ